MTWSIAVNDVLARRTVHERHGGSRQNGMTRPAGSDELLLFSSTSGHRFGYSFDGWRSDGTFHYTGEGQVGDQVFTRGNAALRDHVQRGLKVRLFEEAGRSTVRYLGEFRLAPTESYYFDETRDRLQELRKVIVYRLLPVEIGITPTNGNAALTPDTPTVRQVPVEEYRTETVDIEAKQGPAVMERRESALVRRYSTSLATKGAAVTRNEIRIPNLAYPFYTDLFDASRSELIEAKGSSSRHHVRLAIGQLFDYGRYVDHQSLAVLLPSDPGKDLISLLRSQGIVCIYECEPDVFVRRDI